MNEYHTYSLDPPRQFYTEDDVYNPSLADEISFFIVCLLVWAIVATPFLLIGLYFWSISHE